MNQIVKVQQWLEGLRPGVEIGPFKSPIPGIRPIYVDKYSTFANEQCIADYYGEATELPFHSNSLAYVASSHILEHVTNPIKALVEWHRVLRPGGLIYLVVPDRRYTWDRNRALTPVQHMMDDYLKGTSSVDGTHIDDFADNVDWSTYSPETPAESVPKAKEELRSIYWQAIRSGNEINIHFHVFELSNLAELLNLAGKGPLKRVRWTVLDVVEQFPSENPNGILFVIRVHKGLKDKIQAGVNWLRWRLRHTAILLPTATVIEGAHRP